MARTSTLRIVTAVAAAAACTVGGGVAVGPAAAQPKPVAVTDGAVNITFGPSEVQRLFKAGVFMYGASSVNVIMSDSGSLTATFPLGGESTTVPTTRMAVDPEIGAISTYNGPAEARAGVGSIVIRRTGTTGVVNASIVGPYSNETGQSVENVTLFTLSGVKVRQSSCEWTLSGRSALTQQAAASLNALLKTTVFTAGSRVGNVTAEVRTC